VSRLPVGVGVVGASPPSGSGGWAARTHVPALQVLPEARLTAVCTRRLESARLMAREHGVRGYISVAELARDPQVDLVTVAVKVPDHEQAVMSALNAGLPVYCEWPLAPSTITATRLLEAAIAAGVPTFVGLQARCSPAVVAMRDLIADGYVGRVLSTRAWSTGAALGGQEVPADREWATAEEGGLSALSVRSSHLLDVLTFVAGPLERAAAEVLVATPRQRIEGTDRSVARTASDQVVIAGRHRNGASSSLHVLLGPHPLPTASLSILGTAGTLELHTESPDGQIQLSPLRLVGARHGGILETLHDPAAEDVGGLPAGAAAGVARAYQAVAAVLRGEPVDFPDFAHAVWLHATLDTLRDSAASGVRRSLESPAPGSRKVISLPQG
jgi:predicted dehydrogenase